MFFIDHSMGEFVDSYRMNFRNWKIVDIDNWMGGNPVFSKFNDADVWNSEMKEKMGNMH